ncbi:hypothetical protein ACWF2L_21705 [Streptomyces anulatus]
MSGVHAKNTTGLQKTPAPVTDLLTDAWSTSAPEIPPTPVVDPAADPGDTTPPPANPAPARTTRWSACARRTTATCRTSSPASRRCAGPATTTRTSPAPVDKRGAEFLYRAGDLKKWARNRPRAGTTDPD